MINEFIKNQKNILGISGRKLSEKIGKSPNYISSVEKGLFNPDFETACKIIEELRVSIPNNDIEAFLLQFNIKKSNTNISDEELKNSSILNNEYELMKNRGNYIDEMIGNITDHPQKIKNELQAGLDEIYRILKAFIDKTIDINDYSSKHRAETVLKTLIEMFTKKENFSFFESLLNIPLHRIEPDERQKLINFIENDLCKYEYHFIDNKNYNDNEDIHIDDIIENYPHYVERFKPEESQKVWDNLSNSN